MAVSVLNKPTAVRRTQPINVGSNQHPLPIYYDDYIVNNNSITIVWEPPRRHSKFKIQIIRNTETEWWMVTKDDKYVAFWRERTGHLPTDSSRLRIFSRLFARYLSPARALNFGAPSTNTFLEFLL